MKVHEFQAKALLRKYKVPLLEGGAAATPAEARQAAERIGGSLWVVKSQIHAGGRGKGRFKEQVSAEAIARVAAGEEAGEGKGGVRLARSLDEVAQHAQEMLGNTLVTKQTGAGGTRVAHLFVEAGCDIDRELYLSILLDRSKNRILIMASLAGGMDIEEVAEHHPEQIVKLWVHPTTGLTSFQARQLGFELGLTGAAHKAGMKMFQALYDAYLGTDCSMLEINPLVVTKGGDVIALDAKMTFDDNALFRQTEIAAMRDESEEDPAETEAAKWNLSYVSLDGNIGCMVNGAGLAMSTMDIIQFKGAKPANFLDVGGGANQEQVSAAFRIITRDPAVKGILVNIFGGIMKCDVIAQGVIAAVKEVGLKVPLVVRLSGTNSELGAQVLRDSGLAITPANNLDDAADAIVAAVKGA
ncbi:MAG: ADP-forming succinate--CoA ligase subunit beta [Myxococcota bacterium]